MKNIKKNALKIVVLIALSAPAAFAEGDMPGGGLASSGDGTGSGDVVVFAQTSDTVSNGQTSDTNSLLSAIYEYLGLMM